MARKDYYKILELDKKASQQEIKKAFRKQARKYHPDVSEDPKAREKFTDLAEAYEVLNDPERRKLYDGGQIDQAWFSNQTFDHVRDIFEKTSAEVRKKQTETTKKDSKRFKFGDFISNIVDSVNLNPREQTTTKSSTQNSIPSKDLDLEQKIQISLEEATHGTKKPVDIKHEKSCVLCGGSGEVGHDLCRNCFGKGKVRTERHLEVKIPAGVRNGSKIRVVGEGLKKGSTSGNLYLKIELLPHKYFDMQDNGDLRCEVPVTVTEAILGTELQVPTLSGRVKMKIPPGTQGGQVFRLRNKGLKQPKGQDKGDLYVMIQIMVPKALSEEDKKAYQKLFQSGDEERRKLGP